MQKLIRFRQLGFFCPVLDIITHDDVIWNKNDGTL